MASGFCLEIHLVRCLKSSVTGDGIYYGQQRKEFLLNSIFPRHVIYFPSVRYHYYFCEIVQQ